MDWNRIIELVHKTGERCIIVDPTADEPVVIMSLSEFEELTDMIDIEDYDNDEVYSLPEDIPFEPEFDSSWYTEMETEKPLEITPVDDTIIDDEPWYIEPISDGE